MLKTRLFIYSKLLVEEVVIFVVQHFFEPEMPLENIDAYVETIEEFGYYK